MHVAVENPSGRANVLLLCEHASRTIPSEYGDLGLAADILGSHCAWDIGAHALAQQLSRRLNAPLIAAAASRLLIDANRAHDAPDLIPGHAEGVEIAGNRDIAPGERAKRIAQFHDPFHSAVSQYMETRPDLTAVVSVHSFTPVLFGQARPWHVGVLFDEADRRLADPAGHALAQDDRLVVGRNQPYAPAQGIYYTMERHARPRELASLMFEVRNDLLGASADIAQWADRLAHAVDAALAARA